MLRLLADENFSGDIVRGLLLRRPELDIVRVQDVDLSGTQDPGVLAWAADNNRIVLTHDRATMPRHAVFVLSDRFPVGQAIQELLRLNECSEQAEWRGLVVFLPL
jgi:predicted nuclease of predicted toxin-antitoxin system